MKHSAAIKTLVCLSVLFANFAFAGEWIRVAKSNPEGSAVYNKVSEIGLTCEYFVTPFDGRSILASCRDAQNNTSELGLYILKKVGDSYSKNLLFKLGDASRTISLEFHSPKTITNHLNPQSKDKTEQRIVLIDVMDEGNCYATEVFGLDGEIFNHLGTVEFSALGYTMHPDSPIYETRIECLGQYGRVDSKGGKTTLTFSAPQIYKMNSSTGNLMLLKESELKYRLFSSKLTRIK